MSLWTSTRVNTDFLRVISAVGHEERVAACPAGPLIVVVPTSRQRAEFLVAWARNNGRGEPPDVMTMAGFMRHVGRTLIPDGPRILPDSSVDVVLRAAAHRCGLPPGSVRLTASRLARWAQEGLTSDHVARLADTVEGARRRRQLAHTARVWAAFNDLAGTRACDRGTYARLVCDAAAVQDRIDISTSSGDPVQRLLVLDTHGVTYTDKMLLHALSAAGWDVAVAFAEDGEEGSDAETSRSVVDRAWFVAHGWTAHDTPSSDHPAHAVRVTLRTRTDEVRRALGVVKEAVAAGIPLSDIALCLPGRDEYERIIEELAVVAEIPLDRTGGRALTETRSASAIMAAGLVIAGGWRRDDLDRLLRDPLVHSVATDASQLLRVGIEERIIGGEGAQAWIDRCAECLAEAERGMADDDDRESRERAMRRYDRALRTARSLQQRLDVRVDVVMDAVRFTDIVRDTIMGGLGIRAASAEREPDAIDAIEATLASYRAVSVDHDLPPRSFRDHLHLWWSIVRSTSIERPGRRRGLAVVRPAELRGRRRALVIALGCVDGEFPRRSKDVLDDDLTPGLQDAMARESLADIRASVRADGSVIFLAPHTVDGSAVLPSSLLRTVPVQETSTPWRSLDPSVNVLLGERDRRIRTTTPILMDTSQEGVVLAALAPSERELFEHDLLRPVSPSRLDVVAACPFRYLSQKLLRLDEVRASDDKLTPIERGNILHEVARRFYRTQQPEGCDLTTLEGIRAAGVDLRGVPFETSWQRLCAILDQVLGTASTDHTFASVERQALVGTVTKPGLLHRWLAREIDDQERTGFLPVFLEQEIECDITVPTDAGPLTVPVKVRIDRIDVCVEGDKVLFAVNDYKTSIDATKHGRGPIVEGRATQMPLYVAAVRNHLGSLGIEAVPSGAVYRAFGNALRSPEKVDRKVVLASEGSTIADISKIEGEWAELSLETQIENILGRISVHVSAMRAGSYPVRPFGRVCDQCDYSEFCRIDHWGSIPLPSTEDEDEA